MKVHAKAVREEETEEETAARLVKKKVQTLDNPDRGLRTR